MCLAIHLIGIIGEETMNQIIYLLRKYSDKTILIKNIQMIIPLIGDQKYASIHLRVADKTELPALLQSQFVYIGIFDEDVTGETGYWSKSILHTNLQFIHYLPSFTSIHEIPDSLTQQA